MIKFELKEQFDVQGEKHRGVIERYELKEREAGTRLADLKAVQTAILHDEFSTGKDREADKAKTRADIVEAEREYAAAQLERAKAYDYARVAGEVDRIKPRDVTIAWNGPFRAEVRETELKPIVSRIAAAREEYLNAVLDYYDLLKDYAPLYKAVSEIAYADRQADGYISAHEVATLRDLPLITNDDLLEIENRKTLPSGVKRVKGSAAN